MELPWFNHRVVWVLGGRARTCAASVTWHLDALEAVNRSLAFRRLLILPLCPPINILFLWSHLQIKLSLTSCRSASESPLLGKRDIYRRVVLTKAGSTSEASQPTSSGRPQNFPRIKTPCQHSHNLRTQALDLLESKPLRVWLQWQRVLLIRLSWWHTTPLWQQCVHYISMETKTNLSILSNFPNGLQSGPSKLRSLWQHSSSQTEHCLRQCFCRFLN